MYKNISASEYSKAILLLISSCTPVIEQALLARDCQTGKFVFSYLLACLKSGRTCNLHETTFVTTTDNGDSTGKKQRKIKENQVKKQLV